MEMSLHILQVINEAECDKSRETKSCVNDTIRCKLLLNESPPFVLHFTSIISQDLFRVAGGFLRHLFH